MPSPFPDNPEFAKLLAQRDDEVDLVGLMLEFARDAYPDLCTRPVLAQLDELGNRARELVAAASEGIVPQLEAVSRLLHDREGFRGNQESYYDPRNSYLNEVLERRLGIPISLAIIYTAVGRRAGLDLFGVGTPGHFVVGCRGEGQTLYVDPFTDGAVLDEGACRDRIHGVLGQQGVLTSDHFRPATPREIAARVLRNLKAAHAMADAWPQALPVQLRLVALLPDVADERRDLGLIYLRNSNPHPAAAILEEYVQNVQGESVEAVMPFLKSARRMAAERN